MATEFKRLRRMQSSGRSFRQQVGTDHVPLIIDLVDKATLMRRLGKVQTRDADNYAYARDFGDEGFCHYISQIQRYAAYQSSVTRSLLFYLLEGHSARSRSKGH